MTDLGLCHAPHPHGVKYHLQHLVQRDDGPENPKWPKRILCPWCDWQRLRDANGQAPKNLEEPHDDSVAEP